MIEALSEELIPLVQAAELLPRRRRGRKTHVSTLYRWATAGCRGVVLETIQVGGTRCTSPAALQAFFEALTLSRTGGSPGSAGLPLARRTAARRARDARRAGDELEAMGA